jgi:hypothetical protein
MTGTIPGALIVHPGDHCVLENANVIGAIHMSGGTLNACGSTISAGVAVAVMGENSAYAWVNFGNVEFGCAGNNIQGGVFISGVTGEIPFDETNPVTDTPASVELETNTIAGSVVLTHNGLVEFESNHVIGTCAAFANTGITNFINIDGPNVYIGGRLGCPD